MVKKYLLLSGFALGLLASSCRKKDDPVVPVNPIGTDTTKTGTDTTKTGTDTTLAARKLTLKFANTVDGQPLVLGAMRYKNAYGDSFSVSTYKYYVSNVSFAAAGSTYTVPDCYKLVRAGEDSTLSITLKDVPAGNYTSVTFLIGVDKPRNTSGAQTGDLDPLYGMLWDWKTGYIMAKMEGNYKNSSKAGSFQFHISGFNDDNSVLKWVTLTLPQAAVVAAGKSPVINLQSNVNEWFVNPAVIDLSVTNSVSTTGITAMKIAGNYADMFTITSVENK